MVALVLGLLLHVTQRDAAYSLLVPRVDALTGLPELGAVAGWLPSFIHPFAFSLLSAALLPAPASARYGACIAWCAVNIAFEVGQHPRISPSLAENLDSALGKTPLGPPAQALADCALRGTFDTGDIVAAMLGALAAAMVLFWVERQQETDHAN